ncbi:hypothetical protein SDC9_180474 [bioreactor metagenome]|uniref:(d)CMP kinase n=1 Tax=bioreactor metagenome TaxID=1076179 RepID=A0A645H1U6_9ZZZZ
MAIDGNCGSGKSTLASLIAKVYECNLFHMDHYFLRPGQKTESRLKEAGGNVDYDRFSREIIGGLASRRGFWYRIYDCKNQVLGRPVPVSPQKINIVEGSYSMHPAFRCHYDLRIFLRIEEEEQQRRILERNGALMLKRFLDEWIPLENQYFQELSVEKQCDLVFLG